MSKILKTLQYCFIVALIVAFAALMWYAVKGYTLLLKYQKQSNNHLSQESKIHQNNEDLEIMKQDIRRNSEDIMRLMQFIAQFNQESIKSEKYSRVLFVVSNLKSRIITEQAVSVESDIKTILENIEQDTSLHNSFTQISGIKEIRGLKYFKGNFNTLVRTILKDDFESNNKIIIFFRTHIAPHFAYITPRGSHIQKHLHAANVYLENNQIQEFYRELQEIESTREFYVEYMSNLQKTSQVLEKVDDFYAYIEGLLAGDSAGNSKLALEGEDLKTV